MISEETLESLKAYLDKVHPSYRETKRPETVGEWGPREESRTYYISKR